MKKRDWYMMAAVIVFALIAAVIIGIAIDDMENQEIERLNSGISVDSLRSIHYELNLRATPDSI